MRTASLRQDAISLICKEGYTLKEASERLGIHESVLGKWRRQIEGKVAKVQANQNTPDESLAEENRRLKTENRRLQMERDILKKATACVL
jgi:transposase